MNNINDNVMIEKEIKDYDHRSISSFSKSNLRKLDTDSKKKLEKLKEYENSVVNFSNLEKIFNKSNKNLNVENNHETTILKKDNSHPKSKSKIKSLSSTKLIKTNILFSSSSKNQSIKNLAGSKGLDMIKNRLYEIYKTNPTEENKVQRVKKMKNLDLNEYQKRLFGMLKDSLSSESLMKLSNKFREIQYQAENLKMLEPYDINDDINIEEYKVAFEALRKKMNYKIKKSNKIEIKHSPVSVPKKLRKNNRDIRLDKLSYILPEYLIKKLESNQ